METVFMEIRRKMQSGLLIIREPNAGSLPVDISVSPGSLEIKSCQGCNMISFPEEVRIVPSSCRGLQYIAGDGLHVRLQIEADSNTKLISTLSESPEVQKSCIFYCQSCGEIIIKERTFLRVLPLPSENWSALVEEWCCHPNPFAKSALHPQNDDCFFEHTYFLVNSGSKSYVPATEIVHLETEHSASERSFALKSKENTTVICKRCKRMLGETVSSGITKYYFTEMIIQPPGKKFDMIPRSQFVQSIIAQCLMQLSSARSTFRFRIQGHDGKIYILMWLLNSDTLLVESMGNSASSSVFTLFEDNLRLDSKSLGTWDAVKVLYHPCIKNRNKELSDAWENDIGVHPLTFPSKTCLELLLILSLSTASLPPSLRFMNSFQITVQQHQTLSSERNGPFNISNTVIIEKKRI
ncbi:E3 ubiquitin-protein ligase E3D isoform X2 [Pelodiscus sinensis]|uniref:E3 ubiquitin-protein ligase E3D isoform X2 n=1 Tax=Pelodiscus sinensis TaxID=13735 RepID=UPI00070417F0|nr:E3 ubiquitin-protein ligase E3D isoform X1 [Pelodiscus sinensis]|eukprot:XP_014425430.1 E3 ubiquitin-protein ligase E3D isoform X1 [Pelodiscus sinensis]